MSERSDLEGELHEGVWPPPPETPTVRIWVWPPPPETPTVRLPNNVDAPAEFTAVIAAAELPYLIVLGVRVMDAEPVVVSVSTAPLTPGGEQPWVHQLLADLPQFGLREWARRALALAASANASDQIRAVFPEMDAKTQAKWAQLISDDTYGKTKTKRRRHITRDLLAQVAEVYRDAYKEGRHPTQAVETKFSVSHTQAARYVAQARRAGLLGATRERRAGEGT